MSIAKENIKPTAILAPSGSTGSIKNGTTKNHKKLIKSGPTQFTQL